MQNNTQKQQQNKPKPNTKQNSKTTKDKNHKHQGKVTGRPVPRRQREKRGDIIVSSPYWVWRKSKSRPEPQHHQNRTFPKMLKCFQNRSKQTVIKSAKSLKLENTLVSLKTQIPANTEVKTQCHQNRILFFFRPTPLGFRQVVQHVRLHVATSKLTNSCNDVGSSMTASNVTEIASNEIPSILEHSQLIKSAESQ